MSPSEERGPQWEPETSRIVDLVARGWTNSRIAKEMNLGTATLQRKLRAAAEELGVGSRIELAVRAVELGLIRRGDAERPGHGGGSDRDAP